MQWEMTVIVTKATGWMRASFAIYAMLTAQVMATAQVDSPDPRRAPAPVDSPGNAIAAEAGSVPNHAAGGIAGSVEAEGWTSLLPDDSLEAWQITQFGGEGSVQLENGTLSLGFGSPLTGIHWTGELPLPTLNYELQLEARRVAGSDFFCGLTFPYRDSHASLIIGGWGGGLVGISSLNGQDASENETTRYREFETGRWYRIRLRVRQNRLEAWLDETKLVDCDVRDRVVSTRAEVALSRPLGVASYETRAEIRSIQWRPAE